MEPSWKKWSMSPSSSHTNGWKVWSDMERSLEAATLWNHFRFMPKPRQLAKGRKTKITEMRQCIFSLTFRSAFLPPCMFHYLHLYFRMLLFLQCSQNKTTMKHPTQPSKNCIKVPTPTGVIIFPIQPMPLFQGELPQNYHACLIDPSKMTPIQWSQPNHPSILY